MEFVVNRSPLALAHHEGDKHFPVFRTDDTQLKAYVAVKLMNNVKPVRYSCYPGGRTFPEGAIEVSEYTDGVGTYGVQWKEIAPSSKSPKKPPAPITEREQYVTAHIPFIVFKGDDYPDYVTPRLLLERWGYDTDSIYFKDEAKDGVETGEETLDQEGQEEGGIEHEVEVQSAPKFTKVVPEVTVIHPAPIYAVDSSITVKGRGKEGVKEVPAVVFMYPTKNFAVKPANAPLRLESFYPGSLPKFKTPKLDEGVYIIPISKEWHIALVVYTDKRLIRTGGSVNRTQSYWRTYPLSNAPWRMIERKPMRKVYIGDMLLPDTE